MLSNNPPLKICCENIISNPVIEKWILYIYIWQQIFGTTRFFFLFIDKWECLAFFEYLTNPLVVCNHLFPYAPSYHKEESHGVTPKCEQKLLNLVCIWHWLKKLDFFTIQLILTTIHGSHCIFWYYSWILLYYFSYFLTLSIVLPTKKNLVTTK